MYSLTSTDPKNPEGLNQYIARTTLPGPYEVLPGVYSQMPLSMELNWHLYNALKSELPPSKATGALLDYPGIPDEWSRLLNIMGVAHDPEGVPPFSTRGYHEMLARVAGKKGKEPASKLDADGRRRAQWLAQRLIGTARFLPVHVKRMVVTGVPQMSSGIDVKHGIISGWHKNYERYADMIVNRRLRDLADLHDVYFAYFTGRRYQPDKVKIEGGKAKGKDRIVLDWTGRWVVADKTLPDIVQPSPYRQYFLACRSRKISASPLGATYPLRIVAKQIETHLDALFEFTFMHTGADSLTIKTAGRNGIFMLDVDNHDVNMPPELRDIFCARVSLVFGPFYGHLGLLTMRMPQLIRNDYRFGKGVKLQGDPFDLSTFSADYVNPSGHPWTSLLAKFAGAFFAYDGLVRLGKVDDTEEALEQLLRGELDVAFLNAGDNLAVLGLGDDHQPLADASPFCIYSTTNTFQGLVAVRTPSDRTMWVPNIASYALNFFVPGRPIGHPQRGHWANGWLERRSVYAAAPAYAAARQVVNTVVRDAIGMTMDDYAELRRSYRTVEARSAVDSEFLLDPDIIYYKRHAEDISDEVIEQVYFVVEPKHYLDMHNFLLQKEIKW